MFLSPVELVVELETEVDAAVVSLLADLSPLLLHAVMIENNPAEAIIKNFFILMILV